MKSSFRPGLKFVENQVNGRVSGLHCTWLVLRTRVSSDDVDGFLTLRADLLEEGRSTLRAWPNRLTQDDQRYNKPLNLVSRGTQISYSAAVDLVAELGSVSGFWLAADSSSLFLFFLLLQKQKPKPGLNP
ncbi:hypothetical protein M9H77_06405 [Catharanthus roseus]|uniref:Uncharacterized protein n=1 Tax=Catharanthus roseus TaxID=4058 RepID=A0ACC0BRZ9_CATRO|nr:hypothetical protein M9H77_06405 [Catharanthus roseus]